MIKIFRAWNKKYGMSDTFTLTQESISFNNVNDCGLSAIVTKGDNIKWEDFIYMQFTGLKDKNGKEIFEGDIVKFEDSPMKMKPTIEVGRVVFNQIAHGFIIIKPHKVKGWCFGGHIDWNPEVIGNIYENPEMLEEKGI